MTLPELDAILADWKQKMGTIAQNLYDVENLPIYQRLMGVSGMSKVALTGISQQKVSSAIADFTSLYQSFSLLKETIDRADSLRSQMPRHGREPLIADIAEILTGASIVLPMRLIPIQTRDILGAPSMGDRMRLEDLLNQMATLFTQAKTTILEVDSVWNDLEQRLIDLQIRSHPIVQELTSLIHTVPPTSSQPSSQTPPQLIPVEIQQALITFQTDCIAVQNAIDQDPLTANEDMITQLEPRLKTIQMYLIELQSHHQSLQKSLDEGRRSLQALRSNHQSAMAQFAEWEDKILDVQTQVVIPPAEIITELAQWLDRLTKNVQIIHTPAIQVGLSRWQTQCDIIQTQTQTAIVAMTKALQYRVELRGRLIAMKAKATAIGRVEDPLLTAIETQAHKQLYSRPTNLQRSQQLVTEYERSVNCRI